MYGRASQVRTVFVQETTAKNIGMAVNDMLEELAGIAEVDVLDIKYAPATEDGTGWHSALIIYKQHVVVNFPFDM